MNKKIILSAFFLLLSTVLIFAFIMPLFSSVAVLREGREKKMEEYEKLDELIAKVQRLAREYESMGEDINKFYRALPSEKDVPQLLVQFENMAAINGLLLESVNFQEVSSALASENSRGGQLSIEKKAASVSTDNQSFHTMSVSLTLSGSYDAFKEYLNDLEDSIRSMDVQSIKFSNADGSGDVFSVLKFELDVSVYFVE